MWAHNTGRDKIVMKCCVKQIKVSNISDISVSARLEWLICGARCCVEYFYCLHNFLMCRSQAATATTLLSIGVTKNIFGALQYIFDTGFIWLKSKTKAKVCVSGVVHTYYSIDSIQIWTQSPNQVQLQAAIAKCWSDTHSSPCFTSLPYRSLLKVPLLCCPAPVVGTPLVVAGTMSW